MTSCGGKSSSDQPAEGGAGTVGAAGTAGQADLWAGSAGQAYIPIGGSLLPDGGTPDSSDCNGVGDRSTAVSSTVIWEDPPLPQGGTISDGIYHLLKREDFVGPGGSSNGVSQRASATLAISGSDGVSAQLQIYWLEVYGELPIPVEQTETIVVTGTSYTYTVTCSTERGPAEPGSMPFTATSSELLWFHAKSGGVTHVDTFSRD